MTVNTVKAVLAALALVLVSLLMWQGVISEPTGMLQFGIIVGYVVGNGVQSRTGADVPGIIRPRPSGRRSGDDNDQATGA